MRSLLPWPTNLRVLGEQFREHLSRGLLFRLLIPRILELQVTSRQSERAAEVRLPESAKGLGIFCGRDKLRRSNSYALARPFLTGRGPAALLVPSMPFSSAISRVPHRAPCTGSSEVLISGHGEIPAR